MYAAHFAYWCMCVALGVRRSLTLRALLESVLWEIIAIRATEYLAELRFLSATATLAVWNARGVRNISRHGSQSLGTPEQGYAIRAITHTKR